MDNLKQRASDFYSRRDYRKAFATYSQLDATADLSEQEYNSYLKSAKILHKENAKELFEIGLKRYPDFLHIKRNYVDFLIRQKDYEYAEKLVNELLDYDRRDFYSIDLHSEILSKTNRLRLAVEELDKKLNNPSIMNKSMKGEEGELNHTFKTFFIILEDHLDVAKSKSSVIELLLKEGKTMDNINLAFDEVAIEENFTTIKSKYKISPQLSEFLDTYSFLFWKLDKVFKLFKQKEFDKDSIAAKEKLVHDAHDFIRRAKSVIIKLSDVDKKAALVLKYPQKSIFISYCRKDKEIAFKLHDQLKAANYAVRIDEFSLEINDYLAGTLRHLVQNSDYVISIVSKNSLLSEWVGLESIETLFQERYNNLKRKFISVVVDNRVFTQEFFLELILDIDKNHDLLLDLTMKVGKLRVSTELYDISRDRLIDLRNNLKEIFKRVREYLSLDFSSGNNFDDLFLRLINHIENPKPALASATIRHNFMDSAGNRVASPANRT